MQGNYLGHWLLARHLVLQKLERPKSLTSKPHSPETGRPPGAAHLRVVFLSSCVHVGARLSLPSLQLPRPYSGLEAYANSKLCSILAARQFQQRMARWGWQVLFFQRVQGLGFGV